IDLQAGSVRRVEIIPADATSLVVDTLAFAGSLQGSALAITRITGGVDGFDFSIAGEVNIRDALPLDLTLTANHTDWPSLSAATRGDLGQLEITARVEGDWPLELAGRVAPLQENVPFSVVVRSNRALALPHAQDIGALDDTSAIIEGDLTAITAKLNATTRSPWIGTNTLDAELRWAATQDLEVVTASLVGDSGRLSATGSITPAPPWRWGARWTLEDACLPRWREAPGCSVRGTLETTGTLSQEGPTAEGELRLEGEIAQQTATLQGRTTLDPDGTLRIPELLLASGGNSLQLAGELGTRIDLRGELVVPTAAASLPGARGQGRGTLRLAGTMENLDVAADLQLADVAWTEWSASALDITMRWRGADHPGNEFKLTGREVRSPALDAGHVTTLLSGTIDRHALTIDAEFEQIGLRVGCNGSAAETGDWRGGCRQLEITLPHGEPTWQLEETLTLTWDAAPRRLLVNAFCMRADAAEICSQEAMRVDPDSLTGISIQAHDLPIALVAPWLPPELNVSGGFGFDLKAARPRQRPLEFSARLRSDAMRLEPLAAGESLPFDLRDVDFAAYTEGAGLKIEGSVQTGQEGRFRLALQLGEITTHAPMVGEVTVAGIDIAPLVRIVPGTLDSAGQLAGRVTLTGHIDAPALAGEIAITEARFAHEDLPNSIEDLALALRFDGENATFDGRLRTRAGSGDIDGTLHWAGTSWS
ncbi:MAG: hypothetical protein ACO377_15435, partial [Pseudomonadales bacterium]